MVVIIITMQQQCERVNERVSVEYVKKVCRLRGENDTDKRMYRWDIVDCVIPSLIRNDVDEHDCCWLWNA